MSTRILSIAMLTLGLTATAAMAEYSNYGRIELTGLARDVDWPLNRPGLSNAMVCNVNGPDGFLSVRSGPGASHSINRSLKRLAIVEVDTSRRQGHWVAVTTAYRTHTVNGQPQAYADLPVTGWAHDDHLCAFLD